MTSQQIRVMLIEDDPMVQEINRQFIERIDCFRVVGVAGSGEEGIQMVQKEKPDLVMLDIFMPQLNGIETLQKLRAAFAVDVIIVSAANDMQTISQMLRWGAMDYIIKPFTFSRIKQSLEDYCRFKNTLSGKPSVSQSDLDSIRFGKHKGKEAWPLPKGLHQVTMQSVLDFLNMQQKPVSAEEVADGIGIARVTARRYLEYLLTVHQIKLHVQYGGVGRPVNRYIRTL